MYLNLESLFCCFGKQSTCLLITLTFSLASWLITNICFIFLAVVDRKYLCDWAGDDSIVTSWKLKVTERSGSWGELKGDALSPVAADISESTGEVDDLQVDAECSQSRECITSMCKKANFWPQPQPSFPLPFCSAGDQTLGLVCLVCMLLWPAPQAPFCFLSTARATCVHLVSALIHSFNSNSLRRATSPGCSSIPTFNQVTRHAVPLLTLLGENGQEAVSHAYI